MNQNAEAIAILCSHLCVGEGVKPLEPLEWSRLAQWLMEQELEPRQLLDFTQEDFLIRMKCSPDQAERLLRLIDRSASLGFEVSRYASIGIQLVTRADAEYPKQLKRKLKNTCPPILYCAGNPDLLNESYIGYTGSRSIEEQDLEFTKKMVRKTVERGLGVVSGGARGVDTAAETEALLQGGRIVSYLADSMIKRIKNKQILQGIQDGQAVLVSVVKPEMGFRVSLAMSRNRLIYCQSMGTVAVRSDLNKGGTWTGATECMKHQWSPVFCWNHPEYPGNAALIRQGAIGIDASWDADVTASLSSAHQDKETGEQLNLFNQ